MARPTFTATVIYYYLQEVESGTEKEEARDLALGFMRSKYKEFTLYTGEEQLAVIEDLLARLAKV